MKKIFLKIRGFCLRFILVLFYILALGIAYPLFLALYKGRFFSSRKRDSYWHKAEGYSEKEEELLAQS